MTNLLITMQVHPQRIELLVDSSVIIAKNKHNNSQIALKSISEHVTTTNFWGSAPRPPIGAHHNLLHPFMTHPPLSIPGYTPLQCWDSWILAIAPVQRSSILKHMY